MEREVGGGIGMGNTCKPLAVSFQCMTKSTTNKKKKKKKNFRQKCPESAMVCHILHLPSATRSSNVPDRGCSICLNFRRKTIKPKISYYDQEKSEKTNY